MKSFAAATVLSLASSATALNFLGTAVHSGDFRVHQKGIAATGFKFYVGGNTSTYCPEEIYKSGGCPTPGDITAFTGTVPNLDRLFLDAEVPGGQSAYIEPEDGHLAFTAGHTPPPVDAITSGFTYKPTTTSPGSESGSLTIPGSAIACDCGDKGYQIFSEQFYKGTTPKDQCITIGIATLEYKNGAAAWQYI